MGRRAYLLLTLALVAGSSLIVQHEERRPRDFALHRSNLAVPGARAAPHAVPAGAARAEPAAEPASRQPGVLFNYVRPAGAAGLDAALPAPSQEVHYIRLNRAMLAGKPSPFWQKPGAGRVVLPLPDGRELAVRIDDSRMLGPDRFVSRGRIEGRPASRAIFAVAGGFLHASIEDPEAGSFAIRAATEDVSQFFAIDPALLLRCGGERPAPVAGTAGPARAGGGATADDEPAAPITSGMDRPAGSEVHVLMAYTQDVLATMTGAARIAAIQSAFDLAIEKANTAFEASRMTTRLKLVRIAEVQYDETASAPATVQDDALTAIYKTNDGKMDEIHAIRDQAGADVVCLALNRRDAVSSGLAFLLTEGGELANPLYAFAVVQYSQVVPSLVVAHEIGHLFGCAHERLDYFSDGRPPTAGRFPYSYGYRFRGANGVLYHDIMAYPPGTELPYFSNPRMDAPAPAPTGSPGGIAAGSPGETDTSRTIEEGAFEVAGYRLQTQSAPNSGTLINVATRAYVGRGDQVLIGGFVVQGAQRKRMLVRGSGPALAAFGVTDVLADPVLRVVPSGGDTTWQNDNWSFPPQAADIAAISAQVGAFPFAAGSPDAALLLDLPPGGYSAILEGAGGTSGTGLIEAYEVDHTGSRVVNLATRGYADNTGHEMLAGFVVQGAAGTTKRILIRVLGPSLGRAPYGMTGVLPDPFLQLRGAEGRLLLENDDWSSAARDVNGERDDFQPVVQQYNEQQIAATGLAPTNRREPCMMLDLAPGNYTLVVKPFERRDSNPQLDQPAEPGVGIIEVYEIAR